MMALFKDNETPGTCQGSLKIKVLVRDKETKEPIREQYIKRALLAKLLHEGQVFGLNGQFIIEV